MFWRGSSRVFNEYSNLMSDKDTSIKEKLRQALASTIRVISEDFKIKKNEENKNSKKFDFFELDNLNTKTDFIKARADADSSALKKKFSNASTKIFLQSPKPQFFDF